MSSLLGQQPISVSVRTDCKQLYERTANQEEKTESSPCQGSILRMVLNNNISYSRKTIDLRKYSLKVYRPWVTSLLSLVSGGSRSTQ